MGSDQRFSLKWNNYQSHLVTAFESLLGESDFVDVTLGVEGRRLSAHKMLLSACSPYFRELLKGNPCQHPIIVLRDIRYDDLHALLQFMYNGEVNVAQDQLNSFLKSAEHLKVRGLTDNTDDDNNGIDTASSKDSSSATMNANSVSSPTTVPAKKKRPLAAAGSNNDGSGSSGPPMKRPSSTASASAAGIASMSLHHKKEAEPVKQEVIDINDDQYDEPDVSYDDGGGGGGVVDHHAGVVEQYEGGGGGGYGDEGGTLAVPDGGDIDQHTDGQGLWQTLFPLNMDDGKDVYSCETCGKEFRNEGSLAQHKPIHRVNTTCELCGTTLSRVQHYRRHMRTVHNIDPSNIVAAGGLAMKSPLLKPL